MQRKPDEALPQELDSERWPCLHNSAGHEKFRQAKSVERPEAGTADGYVLEGSHSNFCKHCGVELAE